MGTPKGKNTVSHAARTRAVTRKGANRKPASTHPRAVALAVATAFLPWYLPQAAYGQTPAPNQMPNVVLVQGQAYIADAAGTYQRIDQASLRAIYEGSMTMGVNAHLDINQAFGRAGIGLFRDVSGSLTQIFGRITSNGQVFISNQNGILFGASARVDVGSLFATSLSIQDHDFMAGRYNFYNEGNAGSVTNKAGSEKGVEGHIITANGYTALVGPQVRNDGLIIARAGNVTLAAGNRVTLDMIGDGLISLSIDQAAFNASVVNTGRIEADGGTVLLAARSANALLDTVINNSGVIRANSLLERNGEIVLDGGNAGVVANTGTLSASGTEAGTTGGTIKILGENVMVGSSARLDASGHSGGGTVLVGGNFQGQGAEHNAQQTTVEQGALISADAIVEGNGGKVIVWADDTTRFHGHISARGGADSGNGGFAEVSGKQHIYMTGHADLRAPNGKAGRLLVDPGTVTIIDDVAANNAAPDTFTDEFIEQQLALGDFTITTAAASAGNEDILFQDATISISWITNQFTLNAGRNIVVQGSLNGGAGSTLTFNFGQTSNGILDLSAATTIAAASASATGGAGTDTIIGQNIASSWSITGSNSGSLNGMAFSAVENLTGGTGVDSFTLSATGNISGTIDGGTGSDTLTGNNLTNNWAITASNGGTLTDSNGANVFTGIENLTGGTGTDGFQFASGGSVAGTVNGGGGANTLDYNTQDFNSAVTVTVANTGTTVGFQGTATGTGGFDNVTVVVGDVDFSSANVLAGRNAANTWSVTGTDSGSYASGNTLSFTNFGSLTGNANTDSFTIGASGSISGTLDGGTGTDTLQARDAANTWNITGNNAGNVTNVAAFQGIENLVGGSNTDAFVFGGDFTVGSIDGGAGTASDSISWASYTTARGVTLTATGGNDGFAGTEASLTGTGFTNINSITGATGQANSLTGLDAASTWAIASADGGTYTSTNSLAFSAFPNLTGGNNTDSFTIGASGSISGTLDGGTGTDTLQARDAANTWNITGNNAGNVTNVAAFQGIENLVGGSNTDAFVFGGDFTVGSIDGGAGNDTLNLSAYTTGRAVSLTALGGTDGFTGTDTSVTGGFTNVDSIVGATGQANSLTGINAPATWTVSGTDSGTYTSTNSLTFSAFPNLQGNAGNDDFVFAGAGNLTGLLSGGLGTNSLTASNGTNTWTIAGANSGTLNLITGGWSNIQNLVGGTGIDNFTMGAAGSVSSIDGGVGNDTLTGANIANTWTIGAVANSGTLNGITWSNIENISGGTSTDSFTGGAGSVAGTISDGGGGATTLSGTITSGAAQSYTAAVTLGGATNTTSTSSSITFGSTVNGAQALTVSTSTTATFTGAVTVNSLNATGATINVADVTTNGAQSYTGSVNATGSSYATNGGSFTVSGNTTLNNTTTVNTSGGSITFTGSVNADANTGDGQEALTTNGGSTSIGGPIGNSQALGGLTVTATGAFNLPSATIAGNLSITTSGDITQSGPANVTGTAGLAAGIGSVTMSMANDFGGTVTAAGTGGISLNDVNTLTPGVINAGSGSVILRANSLAGGGTVTGGTAEFGSNTNVSALNVNMPNVPLNLTGSALQWALTGAPATGPNPITVGATNVTVTYNGATAVASLAQTQAANAASTVSSAVSAVIVDEANKTFGTDSVAEDVEYGFAGEIGATPPMDHRIDESGISLPRCVTESREGVPCK